MVSTCGYIWVAQSTSIWKGATCPLRLNFLLSSVLNFSTPFQSPIPITRTTPRHPVFTWTCCSSEIWISNLPLQPQPPTLQWSPMTTPVSQRPNLRRSHFYVPTVLLETFTQPGGLEPLRVSHWSSPSPGLSSHSQGWIQGSWYDL